MLMMKFYLRKITNNINYIATLINFRLHGVKHGRGIRVNGRILISGRSGILLGNNVHINSNMKSNPIGGSGQTILATNYGGYITIGDNCGISNSAIVSHNSIKIGKNVLIGGNCKIYDTDFHSLDFTKRMKKPDKEVFSAPVLINDGAFIGAHTIILKGVTIGEESIIGAGSVVTTTVPDGELWAGNPARFIRKLEVD